MECSLVFWCMDIWILEKSEQSTSPSPQAFTIHLWWDRLKSSSYSEVCTVLKFTTVCCEIKHQNRFLLVTLHLSFPHFPPLLSRLPFSHPFLFSLIPFLLVPSPHILVTISPSTLKILLISLLLYIQHFFGRCACAEIRSGFVHARQGLSHKPRP